MFVKLFVLALSKISGNENQNISEIENRINKFLKNTIHAEILSLSFKLFLGLTITSAVIFSVIQLGNSLQRYLKLFEHSELLEFLSFGFILISGLISLYFIFYKNEQRVPKTVQQSSLQISAQNLMSSFTEGLIKGLNSKK